MLAAMPTEDQIHMCRLLAEQSYLMGAKQARKLHPLPASYRKFRDKNAETLPEGGIASKFNELWKQIVKNLPDDPYACRSTCWLLAEEALLLSGRLRRQPEQRLKLRQLAQKNF